MHKSHFGGQTAAEHVAQKRAETVESHGAELVGSFAAAIDGLREMAVVVPLLSIFGLGWQSLLLFACIWALWKAGRVAWVGWAHLERLHRIVEEERFEIEHNRDEERRELEVLYGHKGFEGQLLQDVVDVLMADRTRLLRVMVEEEMGLKLERLDHPLQVAAAAGGISLLAGLLLVGGLWIHPVAGASVALALLGTGAVLAARRQGNRFIPAVVWNGALALLLWGIAIYVV